MIKTTMLGFAVLLLSASGSAAARDMMDPLGAASACGAALARGDEATVKSLLAPDVLIYESGGQESSRDEYTSHHMKDDMTFPAASQNRVIERKHGLNDDLAWVDTRWRISGTYKDKPLEKHKKSGAEAHARGWRIVHIQWSSRPADKAH